MKLSFDLICRTMPTHCNARIENLRRDDGVTLPYSRLYLFYLTKKEYFWINAKEIFQKEKNIVSLLDKKIL